MAACTVTHTQTCMPHPLHFTLPSCQPRPPPPLPLPPSHKAAQHTHLQGHTHLHMRLQTRCFPLRLPAAQSRQPPGMEEYYERGLIGRSL